MTTSLRVTLGQASLVGAHDINQDFHGAVLPAGHLLASKGIALAIADGISSSAVSQLAVPAGFRKSIPPKMTKKTRTASRPRSAPASGRRKRLPKERLFITRSLFLVLLVPPVTDGWSGDRSAPSARIGGPIGAR